MARHHQYLIDHASLHTTRREFGLIRYLRIILVKILRKIDDRLFDEFASINSTEHRDIGKNTMDIKRLRDLTAAYKDLTDDLPKAEDKGTMEKLDAMLAEVKSYASNA